MIRPYLSILFYDIFLFSLFAYMTSAFWETVHPGIIADVVNLNAVLFVLIGSGFATLCLPPPQKALRWPGYVGLCAVSLFIGFFIAINTPLDNGWKWLFALCAGMLTFFTCLFASRDTSNTSS